MAASKFFWYNTALKYLALGRVQLEQGTIKAMLLKDSYTPSTASHSALAQVSSFQATASATIVNAITLSGLAITGSGADTVKWDADNIAGFSSDGSTITTAKYMAVYQQSASGGGVEVGDVLLGYVDLNADSVSASVGQTTQVNVTWSDDGIGKLRSNP